MHVSIHEPCSIFFLSALILGQFSCMALHAAFLRESMQLGSLEDYAQSLKSLLAARQDPSCSDVDEWRKQAQIRKQMLEEDFEGQQSSLQWVAVKSKD